MKALYVALSGAILLSAATLCPAASDTTATTAKPKEGVVAKTKDALPPERTMPAADYKADKDKIEADYKAANDKCKDLKGNQKDICHKEAKLDEKSRKADLEAKYKGTEKAQYDAQIAKAKAKLDLEQEKCEEMKGAEKSACKKQAKADEQKAVADAKANRKKVAAAPMSSTTVPPATTTTTPATSTAPASTPPANTPTKKY